MLEHMLSTLYRGPLQTDIQQVMCSTDILGKYELRVRIQFLNQSSYLIRIQSRVVHGAHAAQRGNTRFQRSPDERPRRTPAQTPRRDLR